MSFLPLQDRVAIITGGGRGIGRAIALTYAGEGCNVVLIGRDQAALDEAAAEIATQTSSKVLTFVLDITDHAGINVVVDKVLATFGRIDILVNAAAIVGPVGRFEDCDIGEWEQAMDINVKGTHAVCRAVIPSMIEKHYGTIINFAGGGAFGARERFGAYSVSKAAVVRLTDVMALELKDTGITVNAISPGQVNTRMFEEMVSAGADKVGEKGWAEFQKRLETGGDSPEAAAKLALLLVSEGGRKVTGRCISVQWDPWERLPELADELMASDIYTMRRIKPDDYGKQWN